MPEATERVPAVFRCFDCWEFIHGLTAKSASYVGSCPSCEMGMLMVWELDGEPKNRGYWPPEEPAEANPDA